MNEIIQLEVSLDNSKPLIWRQILVHKDTTFFELHHIIQICMGWGNYHLFEFDLEGYRIGEIVEEDGYGNDKLLDSKQVKLSDIITGETDVINYYYDFGDGWKHQIKVQKFLDINNTISYPSCLAGQMNCPPEDCGGIHAFNNYIEILKNKKHPNYKMIVQWFPKKYNPELFDIDIVNKKLSKIDQYIRDWSKGKE